MLSGDDPTIFFSQCFLYCVGASGIEFPKAGRISGQVEIKLEMAGKCRSPWDCLSNKVRTRKSRR